MSALWIALVLAIIEFAGCANDKSASMTNVDRTAAAVDSSGAASALRTCTQKGIAYFKEIGSYPTLSASPNRGKLAEDVALERCQRTTGAFDGLK